MLPATHITRLVDMEDIFPASIGIVSPVANTVISPCMAYADASQTATPATNPTMAPDIAVCGPVLDHNSDMAIGATAEPINMPIRRYTYWSDSPIWSNASPNNPMPIPNNSIVYRDTRMSWRPVAEGFMYVRYTSYVTSDETLTSCDEPAAVTAVKIIVSIKIAPTSPISTDAVVGATRP